MNAKLYGKIWVVEVTAKQFTKMVEEFFKRVPFPSCDELYQALVPSGVRNSAEEGSYGKNGIFKYSFMSSDGIELMVKYHKPAGKVVINHPKSNSALYWTAQILCDNLLFFGWEADKRKVSFQKVGVAKAQAGEAPKEDRFHIPLRNGPSIGTKDWAHTSKVSFASGDKPASFVFISFNFCSL